MTRPPATSLANEKQLARAVRQLVTRCEIMRAIHARTGMPPLRDFSADFAGIAKIVTGQQLSVASAAAIWLRVSETFKPFEPSQIIASDDAHLAALGLSRAKIRTLKAVAAAVEHQGFDIAQLTHAPDAEIITRLTALHGIGPWTADIYLLFALRRADAFPAGDLALQIAAQRALQLSARPTAAELLKIAERWRPWRGAAARLLWADYAFHRDREKPEAQPAARAKTTAKRTAPIAKKSVKSKTI